MTEARAAEFRGRLYARLRDHVRTHETRFEEPVAARPVADGPVDIYLPGPRDGGLVVAVVADDRYPREREVLARARRGAAAVGAECVATCNSNDLFLFHDPDAYAPGEGYYLDLRAGPLAPIVPDLLDAVRRAHERAALPTQSDRDRVLGLLRSFHAAVWPTCRTVAEAAAGRDGQFTRAFEAWVRANDRAGLDRSAQFALAAKQYAYLRTSEALLARSTTDDAPGRRRQPSFRSAFDAGLSSGADGDLFASFPRDDRTERLFDEFAADIARERAARVDEDLLGEIYEELLPADERRQFGQFYTHPKLAATVCRWAIQRPDDGRLPRVLDPASGSGTFVVEAAKRLRSLADPGATHRDVLDSIAAVDVNRFPLYLTALNLSGRCDGAGIDRMQLSHGSFFDVDPETDSLVDSDRDDAGDGGFDAVVGNPPYVRQEDLSPDRAHFRAHLAAFGPPGTSPYEDGPKRLSKRSDAYVYFVTHATRFLRDGGRLGFIVPTKWLTTRYGESFQEFLYDFYRVEAVVGFSVRAFEDALVDAALLLVERREDEAARRATTTNFVRIRESMDAAAIVDAVSFDPEIPPGADATVHDRGTFRTVAVDQSALMDAGGQKLAPYLQAPAAFIRLLDHPLFTDLGDLGDTHRGVMTGANDFFFLDEDDRETWDLPDRFLAPAIKSIRDVDGQVLRAADSERYLFDVHDYVRQVARDAPDGAADVDLESRVKDALARDGYDETRRYVEWGESAGYHERRSCASRAVWFDLGALDPPAVLHPKFFDERVFVVWNPDRLVPSNAVDCVSLDADVDEAATMGVLNSTVNRAMLECWGRAEGGGALQLMTYEVASLPVLDVRELDADTRGRIAACNERLVAGDPDAQTALDRAVLDALDVDLSVETLQELQAEMVRRRVTSGDEAAVLVDRLADLGAGGKRSAERDSPSPGPGDSGT